jgi:hypothetical protein
MSNEYERIQKEAGVANRGTVAEFAWNEWEIPYKPQVRITGVPSEIRKVHHQNTSMEIYL